MITPPAIVDERPIASSESPSRWRLTYALELVVGPVGSTAISSRVLVNLALNPDRYEVDAAPGVTVTPTVGGVSVDQRGFIRSRVLVSGDFGIARKQGWSPGVLTGGRLVGGGITFADGNTLWRELRRLFELWDAANADPSLSARMIWHDFRNDDHWFAIPIRWKVPRTSDAHRAHYPYEFELETVGMADDSGAPPESRIFRAVGDVVGAATGYINAAVGVVADLGAFVGEVNGTVRTSLYSVIGAGAGIVAAGAGLVQGVRDVLDIPAAAVEAAAALVDDLIALIRDVLGETPWSPTSAAGSNNAALYAAAADLRDSLDGLLSQPSLFDDATATATTRIAVLAAGDQRLSLGEVAAAPSGAFGLAARATPGSSARVAGAGGSAAEPAAPVTYLRAYVVRAGDTVHQIAGIELGDITRWTQVVAINQLVPPYIAATRRPGARVARPGDTIYLPATTGSRSVDEPDRLGVDVAAPDGVWEAADDVGGLARVEGDACLSQGLSRRLRGELGTHPLFPSLGTSARIGAPVGSTAEVALAVRTAVVADDRVASVPALTVVALGDGFEVEVEVESGDGRRVTARRVA
ncbi:MAG: hypothetical protein EKK55_19270 [Rhodocyclaceae bacterium]|nr:MAG: hypothetical protein EKK55_19270 [Rhodocyclaceae bacterium]